MSYTIKITQTKTVKKVDNSTWGVVSTKEVAREPSCYRNDASEPKTRIEEVRGYLPPIEKEEKETIEIFSQHSESLDLAKVIKAINNL